MQTIITKFLGATNTRGNRVTAKSWNGKATESWDYALDVRGNHEAAAKALIADIKDRTGVEWEIVAAGNTPDDSGYAFIIQ